MTASPDAAAARRALFAAGPDAAAAMRRCRIAARLTPEMADADWALDLADRLIAYDPLADDVVEVRFEPGDRIVVVYRCRPPSPSSARHTFVVPKWTRPTPDADAPGT